MRNGAQTNDPESRPPSPRTSGVEANVPLRILEVCSAYPPSRGGVERFVQEAARGLARRGHEVTVLTSSRGLPTRSSDVVGPDGIRVIRRPEHFHLLEAPLIPAIAFSILGLKFDVLHVHGMSPTITDLTVLMGRLMGKPVVVTYHNDAESTFARPIARFAASLYALLSIPFLGAASVVVCSTRSYAQTSPALRRILGKVTVIPMGVDTERFQAASGPTRDEKRRKQVLFVGQLKAYKGVDILIRAIAKLRREGHDIGLQVVGDGPVLPNLKTTANDLGLNGGVKFIGNVDDQGLFDIYNQCDLFVLPSTTRREAFGLVQLEALAAGKRVVASDIPGVGEVARLAGGALARPNDHVSLAAEILKAISAPHEGEILRERARSMTWNKTVDAYDKVFRSLVQVPKEN